MKDYIEERVLELAYYILEKNATVRRAAKKYNISKSTVHKEGVTLKLLYKRDVNNCLSKIQSLLSIPVYKSTRHIILGTLTENAKSYSLTLEKIVTGFSAQKNKLLFSILTL